MRFWMSVIHFSFFVWGLVEGHQRLAFGAPPPLQSLSPSCGVVLSIGSIGGRSDLLQTLVSLEPDLEPGSIEKRMNAATTPLLFFRSFVRLFYALNTSDQIEAFSQLERVKGWIFGDVHVENFGVLLDKKGKPVFTMNDYDDGAQGPLIYDVLRFLLSTRLVSPQLKPSDTSLFLKAYWKGLHGDSLPKSKVVQALLKNGKREGASPPERFYDDETGHLVRGPSTQEVSSELVEEMQRAVQSAYGDDFKIKDALELERDYAGSGGRRRLHALVEMESTGKDKPLVIEFKELAGAAPSAFLGIGQPDPELRIRMGLFLTQRKKVSPYYTVRSIGKLSMLMRPRWEGQKNLDIGVYNKKAIRQLLVYEATLLGLLHRRGPVDLGAYQMALDSLPKKAIVERVLSLEQTYLRLFQTLQE